MAIHDNLHLKLCTKTLHKISKSQEAGKMHESAQNLEFSVKIFSNEKIFTTNTILKLWIELVARIVSNFREKISNSVHGVAISDRKHVIQTGRKGWCWNTIFCHGYANYIESNYMCFQGDVSWHIAKTLAKLTLLRCDKWISDSPSI